MFPYGGDNYLIYRHIVTISQSKLPDTLFTKSFNIYNKCLKSCLMKVYLIFLYLEHEALILVLRVPQSVQKVKTAKFHKP